VTAAAEIQEITFRFDLTIFLRVRLSMSRMTWRLCLIFGCMTGLGGLAYAQPLQGGILFANFCQASGAVLLCTPVTLLVPSGDGKVAIAAKLPEVSQPIEPVASDRVLFMHGAAIDREHGLVFWQAACARRFFTTDIHSGETKAFPIDFAALGIPGAEAGVCLNEWVFDDATGTAIALGGTAIPTGHGKVQFAFALTADGHVSVLYDLRPALDRERAFVHPDQSIVSFDPARREILTGSTFPIERPQGEQLRLRLGLDNGSIAFINGGPGVQAQFFDPVRGKHISWNCFLPGLTDEASFEIKISNDVLREINLSGPTDLCYQGFLGGVYDPQEERFLVLARPGTITRTSERLSIGVIDLKSAQWSHWIATNARYDTFRATTDSGFSRGVVPGTSFFFSVVYTPCSGLGRRCR
jgi:hypothetical protein